MLEAIRDCLEGQIPAVIATCSASGVPNVSFISQVHYIDPQHVALSFQFFNKTHRFVRENPQATAMILDPVSGRQYRMRLRYLRTETSGPVFESMKARLAGIASHTGMTGVFELKGSDIYDVIEVEPVPGALLPSPPRRNLLAAVRAYAQLVPRWTELSLLLDGSLQELEASLQIRHAMIHWLDESGERLYLIASRGYAQSGVGSEIGLGQGVIGTSAHMRVPIRITHFTAEYTYSRAARDSVRHTNLSDRLEAAIPLPGLPEPRSQIAVPIDTGARLLGVLSAESSRDSAFGHDHEDALVAIAGQLALAAQLLESAGERSEAPPSSAAPIERGSGAPAVVRHYPADDTIFVDELYLIKGVAGAILWKLLRDYTERGRTEFTNRELRLDSSIPLPELSSNLEARLILLQRRLAERCASIGIEKTGRGRFRLEVRRPMKLLEAG